MNKEISNEFSKVVNNTLKSSNISPSDISAIRGLYGQTISHKITSKGNSSIQLGCPTTLSGGKQVTPLMSQILDKLILIMAGQGAPLAPLFHDFLFKL